MQDFTAGLEDTSYEINAIYIWTRSEFTLTIHSKTRFSSPNAPFHYV